MIGLVFSLDHEVYGSGAGSFEHLMLRPTDRLLRLFDEYGWKLTIMAEVAEILRIRRQPGFETIAGQLEEQLQRALATGHDVQLHLHPGWFNARYQDGQWLLDFGEYALVHLPPAQVDAYISQGKTYLEKLAEPVRPDYECIAFRAGNWMIQPAEEIVAALEAHGFAYDSTVYKGGMARLGDFTIDFRDAFDNMLPWTVDTSDINRISRRAGGLREIPIFTRQVPFPCMLTPKRLMVHLRSLRGCTGDSASPATEALGSGRSGKPFRFMFPKKFDFSRLTFGEMKRMVDIARRRCAETPELVPVVAIGHSTEFSDETDLRRFLAYLNQQHAGDVVSTTFAHYRRSEKTAPCGQAPQEADSPVESA